MKMDYLALLLAYGMAVIVIVGIIAIAYYVLSSYSHMKALMMLGYDKAWLAWIPYGCFYACADAVTDKDADSVQLFGSFTVPATLFKLWWIVPVAFLFLPLNGTLESVINLVLQIAFMGCTYAKMYAHIENKEERETQAVGFVSGFINIVAVIKFLIYK